MSRATPKVLVGDETGLLKLVSFNREDGTGKIEASYGTQGREKGVERLCAFEENSVVIGTKSGAVRLWNGVAIEDSIDKVGGGRICGMNLLNADRLITCGSEGIIETRSWPEGNITGEFSVNTKVDFGRLSAEDARIAIGGKNVDLKIWDIETSQEMFKAKNVPNDSLDIPVPIWPTDVAWSSSQSVLACTAFNQIRAYDLRQRRPVKDISLQLKGDDQNRHLNCIVVKPGTNDAIVGDIFGKVSIVDVFRKSKLIASFKGPKASVRSLDVQTESNTLACGGLDRYVRIFDLTSHKQLGRCYVKQKLTAVTMAGLPMPKSIEDGGSNDDELDWGDEDDDEEDAVVPEKPDANDRKRSRRA